MFGREPVRFGRIASLRLYADGVELPLDEFGRAHVQATQVGKIALRAEATDVDGLVGSTTSVIRVRDPQDKFAPTPSFASQLAFARLTDVTAITGTTGEANVDNWTLEIARYGDEHYTTLASGDGAVNNAAFLQLDPATLANGMYTLRLRVTDLGGRRGEASVDVEVDSATKTGRLQRNEADFSWSVGGHTLDFLRSYDSLNTSVAGSFGNGWRLSFRDVDLQTDVALTGREDAGELGTFQDGQRVILTLPSGERAAFTFVPQKHSIPGQTWYTPAFQAESASGWQLVVPDTKLQRAGASYYDLVSGVGYNPANAGDTDYILVAPDGTRYSIADGRIQEVRFSDGVHVAVSDSGLVASTGETVQFTLNHAGAIERAALSDGRQFLYDYDAQGRLVSVRNLEAATSLRYGYEAGALGRLTLVTGSGAGALYTYGPSGVGQAPISGDLGSSVNYLATPVNGSLIAGEVDHYAFTLRPSELASTASGSVYLGIVVEGHNGLAPVLPVMPGLTAIASSVVGNRAFALFKLDAAGLAQIDVAGSGVGDYTLSLFVAGDANRDGKVDGADAIAIAAAKGAVRGGAGYSEALDADGNGVIESGDLQLLMQNAGFTPNRAPVVVAGTVKTHVDLDVNAPVSTFVQDPEGDRTFFTILGSTHGTAHLSGDGQSVVFTPEAGYIGTADFTIRADDGFGQTIQTIAVTISNAALTRLDFIDRNLRLAVGEGRQISLIGDFADQANVELPASYVTLMSTDGSIGSLVAGGRINAVGKGSGVLVAERAGLRAATAFTVGVPTDTVQAYLYAGGMTVYPGAVSLAENVGKRQILANLYGALDLAPASSGTHYYVSNDQIISVSADGLISGGRAVGHAWLVRLAAWGTGGILADDMGLGKTVQTIALLLDRARRGPALVIAPTSVCWNWVDELARFAPSLRPVVYADAADRAACVAGLGKRDVLIASYALVTRDVDVIAPTAFATVVLDEAQAVKNPQTRRARAVRRLTAEFRVALSGTPLENHLGDLHSLMDQTNPGLLGTADSFRTRFREPIEADRNHPLLGGLVRMIAPFILRRTRKEVLSELPPRQDVTQLVELSKEEARRYAALYQQIAG